MALIMANCFPKSGTNLLRQMLSGVAYDLQNLSYYNDQGVPKSKKEIMFQLSLAKEIAENSDEDIFFTSHLPCSYLIKNYMQDAKMIILVRDLRGVCVSHAHYIFDTPDHHLYFHYRELPDWEARIRLSITGLGGHFPDIGQRFLPYIPWLWDEDMLLLFYEDLVVDTELEAEVMAGFLGIGIAGSKKLLENVNTETSHTFRKGDPYSWEEEMSEANQRLFDDIAGWTKEIIWR